MLIMFRMVRIMGHGEIRRIRANADYRVPHALVLYINQ
jgi:hypothetical protein